MPGTNVGGTEVGEVDALLAGIQHHLKADEVFHKHPVFTEGERRLAQRFRDARVGAEKIGLFAHIGWELCLDGALLRREGVGETLKRLRQGLDAAQPHLRTAAEHHEPSPPDGFHDRLEALLHQIAWSDWVPGYTHGPGLARRLAGVRRRVRLPPFTDDDLERLGDIFESALDDAGPAVERFVEAWEIGRLEV